MKKWIWSACAVAGMALSTAQPAQAALITFSTTGEFTSVGLDSPEGTVATTTFGTGANTTTITFTGVTLKEVNTPVTDVLGSFQVSMTGTGAGAVAGDFSLNVEQNQPLPGGAGTFPSTFTGSFTLTPTGTPGGGGTLQFSLLSLVVGSAQFDLNNGGTIRLATSGVAGVPGRAVDVSADITRVPEAGSLMLFGAALLGLVSIGRRYQLQ